MRDASSDDMTFDIPIITSYIYFFITSHTYGWGLLHDLRFITLSIAGIFVYMMTVFFKESTRYKMRLILVLIFIFFAVFGTTVSAMTLRNKTSSYAFVSDSALQLEIAGRYLLLGKNPYKENFINTDLAKWEYKDSLGNTDNPALYHLLYPPFLVYISAIGYRVFSQVFGFFDIRIFYLAAFSSIVLLPFIKYQKQIPRLLFLVFVAVQPLFLSTVISGYTDVVVLAFLLWGVYFFEKKKLTLSAVLIGIAFATKQTAWFIFPIIFIYLWKKQRASLGRFIGISSVIALFLYSPFLLWDARAFIDSIFLSLGGSGLRMMPISGYGLGMLLVALGKIPNIYSPYPFWMWQLGGSTIVCAMLLHQKKSWWTTRNLLLSYTLFLSVVWFCSRFFTITHLSYLAALFGATWSWDGEENSRIGR